MNVYNVVNVDIDGSLDSHLFCFYSSPSCFWSLLHCPFLFLYSFNNPMFVWMCACLLELCISMVLICVHILSLFNKKADMNIKKKPFI